MSNDAWSLPISVPDWISSSQVSAEIWYPDDVCTKRGYGDKVDCDAPFIPADLFDGAIIERGVVLSAVEQSPDRIVRAALDQADSEAVSPRQDPAVETTPITTTTPPKRGRCEVMRA